MSKDNRFNKKEYAYEDDIDTGSKASSKQSGAKKHIPEEKPKSSFKRIDKRSLA